MNEVDRRPVTNANAKLARRLLARLRWYELAPEVVLLVGLGSFAATEPHPAASVLKSPKALLLMAVVALSWLIARLVSLGAVRWPPARAVLFGAGALAILKVVVLPAYQNHTVVEQFPTSMAAAAAPSIVPTTSVEMASESWAVTTSANAVSTTTGSESVRIRSGALRGVDHRASGTVASYLRDNGGVVIGLEDFDIQPGPAYALYIVAGTDRRDRDGGTRIERLRGNRGTQYYDVPATVEIARGSWTVLVWCETFAVPVANATPAPT